MAKNIRADVPIVFLKPSDMWMPFNWIPFFKNNRPDWSKTTAYIEYKDKDGNIVRKSIKVTIVKNISKS